ncbi:capsid vertex protein [Serratia phage X20]|uniref:Capsid vertex protein n=1 Tax=Serratia phage X20 TaxID=2006942 RepID=A0A1Z1LZ98_9CAUD|nr:capsid vertex protein [Serratia phage X20]ARW58156.1 capsid vertex protein [Serratia phage X20]
MSKIHNLLRESTTTGTSSIGRPDLVALTRATTNLIYTDLVASQRTKQPEATLYGVKYLNHDKVMSFMSAATYAGAISSRDGIPEFENKAWAKGDLFQNEKVVYKVLKDNPFEGTSETEPFDIISEAIVDSAIRLVAEAADTSKFESADSDVSDASFRMDRWKVPVKSRKLRTDLTVELAQDMEANGFDAAVTVEDVLATVMAEEVNKDIVQSLITVSSRFRVEGISDKGMLDLTGVDEAPEMGRRLYRYICEMNGNIQRQTSYSGTYVLASSRVAAMLDASGWVKEDEDSELSYGKLNNGLKLYVDAVTPVDYVIVGVKATFGELESVGSLFYAPYTEGLDLEDPEHVGAFKVIVDPDSLQPTVCLLVRYGLSVNPYTLGIADKDARVIDGSDMDNLAGLSKMSVLLGVKLPKLIED